MVLAGAMFPVEALPKVWLRGDAPQAWAEDELYVLECWATWCGPCIRAMPHMEALWQTVKDEGIQIIGINVSDRLNDERLRDFLAKQSVPPTYPMAVDREGVLKQRLKFQGIPYACAVRQGEIVWQGHPSSLTAERLRALRDNRPYNPKNEPPPADPMEQVYTLERQADQAAAKGDWDAALALQRKALEALPQQAHLPHPFVPEKADEPTLSLPFDEAASVTTTGDAAPYAALLGRAIPADEALTVIELWAHPWQVNQITQLTQRALPGQRVQAALPVPHRRWTVAKANERVAIEAWAQELGVTLPEITFATADWEALFGVTQRLNYPFVAVFKGGKRLYRGSVELLPTALLTQPEAAPEAIRQAIETAEAREKSDLRRALNLMKAGLEPEALEATLAADPLCDRTNALLLNLRFAPYQDRDDVAGAVALFKALTQRHLQDEHTLSMLYKIPETWPDLASLVHAERSLIAERLALLNRKGDPELTVAWLMVAAQYARNADNTPRAHTLVRRAISATPSGLRWQALLHHRTAYPSR